MSLLPPTGIFAALWTPTDADGRLLAEDVRHNFDLLRRSGIHGVVALGSTGEFIHLEVAERNRVLETVIELAAPLPVVANISEIRPSAVRDLARHARAAGAAAVTSLPPYFFPLAQEDLVEFFVQAGEAADLPMVLYNFPELTGNKVELSTVEAVAARIPVAGVKHSGGNWAGLPPLVALARRLNFSAFTGADTRLAEALGLGVSGCIGGLVNLVPDLMMEIFRAVQAGQPENARLASERMAELGRHLDSVTFPLNVAAAMEARGLRVGVPKAVVSQSTQRRYTALADTLRGLFLSWGLI